ncbi:hypothetical protein REPUB_Repub19eG0110400 [Reevesia pubescens]
MGFFMRLSPWKRRLGLIGPSRSLWTSLLGVWGSGGKVPGPNFRPVTVAEALGESKRELVHATRESSKHKGAGYHGNCSNDTFCCMRSNFRWSVFIVGLVVGVLAIPSVKVVGFNAFILTCQQQYFTVKDARGNDVDLSIYKGKVLLIVNVASQCGLIDSNYTELSQLYEKYKDQGCSPLCFIL